MGETSSRDIPRHVADLDRLAFRWSDRWRRTRWHMITDQDGGAIACFDAINTTPDSDPAPATLCFFEQTTSDRWRAMSPHGWVVLAEAPTLAGLIVLMDDGPGDVSERTHKEPGWR